MSRETLDHAFEPFFSTKAAGRGTGLGLAQVYGFARQSDGTASIDSRPGAGVQASLVVPAAPGDATPGDATPGEATPGDAAAAIAVGPA